MAAVCREPLLMKLNKKPRLVWVTSHRTTYRGIGSLLCQLVPVLLLAVTAIFLPFIYAPFNRNIIEDVISTPNWDTKVVLTKERMSIIFGVPTAGALAIILNTLIHICGIFRRGPVLSQTVSNFIINIIFLLIVFAWCVIIMVDLLDCPNGNFGLCEPLGRVYLHMLNDSAISNSSYMQLLELHKTYDCCGMMSVEDLFTNRQLYSRKHNDLPWPREYNSTHIEIVSSTCCRKAKDCHLKEKGGQIQLKGVRRKGCLLAMNYDLMIQIGWTISLIALALVCCGIAFWVMMRDVKRTEKRRTRFEEKKRLTLEALIIEASKND